MQFATLLLAALSATATATASAEVYSLERNLSNLTCFVRIASSYCKGDSGTIANYNADDNTCHAASDADNHGSAEATVPNCPGFNVYLRFVDAKTKKNITMPKGMLRIIGDRNSAIGPVDVDLGVKAGCSVRLDEGESKPAHFCDH